MKNSTLSIAVPLLALAVGVLAAPALAQLPSPAEQLLRRAAEGYRSAESYYFVASEKTVQTSGPKRKETQTLVLTAKAADGRTRVEFDDRVNGGVAVFDGTANWVYLPRQKRYAKLPTQTSAEARVGGLDFAVLARRFIDRYKTVDQRLVSAELVRAETLPLQGGEVACQVVRALYKAPAGMRDSKIERTYWIAERAGLVVREHSVASMPDPASPGDTVTVVQDVVFQNAQADQAIDEQVFRFVPPPGAQQVESLQPGAAASDAPVSSEAPDFTLTTLTGEDVRLSALRGQVVLLDFWATWCGPCRYDMPFVEALYAKYADRGLHVFGVNTEAAERAKSYLEANGLTFPTLVDPGMGVARLFQVRALPTFVVIDRQGRIAAYMRGSRTEQQLEAALIQAGL